MKYIGTYSDNQDIVTKEKVEDSVLLQNSAIAMVDDLKTNAIAFGNDMFVAGTNSDYGIIAYSYDGIKNWKKSTNFPAMKTQSICFGNGKFVAVGYDANTIVSVAYSTNGKSWTKGAETIQDGGTLAGVAYGNGKFVAVGDIGNLYSTDGISWDYGSLDETFEWASIAFGNGKFVAVTPYNSKVAYSTDGINWTIVDTPSAYTNVAFGQNRFVATPEGGTDAAYSSDGITWNATTMPIDNTWVALAYGGGYFVSLGTARKVAAYSNDGITWYQTDIIRSSWMSVAWSGEKFVAVSNNSSQIAYSVNGTEWEYLVESLRKPDGTDIAGAVKAVLEVPTIYVSTINGLNGDVNITELPEVTTSDNNKILQVVNGEWAAATLPTYNGGVS